MAIFENYLIEEMAKQLSWVQFSAALHRAICHYNNDNLTVRLSPEARKATRTALFDCKQ